MREAQATRERQRLAQHPFGFRMGTELEIRVADAPGFVQRTSEISHLVEATLCGLLFREVAREIRALQRVHRAEHVELRERRRLEMGLRVR
ncbi:hypothetical protein D3C83_06990 [compost metagenome]